MSDGTAFSWATLLERLAPELNDALPPGIEAEADEHRLVIRVEGEIAQAVEFVHLEGADPVGTLEVLLSGVQDLVIRCTGRRWPLNIEPEHAELPLPHVAIHGSEVRIWFSRDDDETFEVASISIGDVS